jgi:hypothetical protein
MKTYLKLLRNLIYNLNLSSRFEGGVKTIKRGVVKMIEIKTNNDVTEYYNSRLEIIHGTLFIHNSIDLSADGVEKFVRKYLTEDEIIDLMMEAE